MDAVSYLIRVAIVVIVAWLGMRLLGRKSIAEITAYDLVGIIIFGTVIAEPLVFKVPSKSVVGALGVILIMWLIGRLSLRPSFYNFDIDASIVIANGKVIWNNLKKNNLNIGLLLSELRLKNYQNISDVQLAILEPTGKVSVFPKPQNRPVQTSDLQIATGKTGLALPLIIEGAIQSNNLHYAGLDELWLSNKLNELNLKKSDVLLLELNSDGSLNAQTNAQEVNQQDIFQQLG